MNAPTDEERMTRLTSGATATATRLMGEGPIARLYTPEGLRVALERAFVAGHTAGFEAGMSEGVAIVRGIAEGSP